MKLTVKLTALFILLMLSFSISGNAKGNYATGRADVCHFVEESSDCKSGFVQRSIHDLTLLHTLTISDVELIGGKLLTEIQSQNLRNRRVIEIFDALKTMMHSLSLREDLLSLDKNKIALDNSHIASSGSDYYVFRLRHILI